MKITVLAENTTQDKYYEAEHGLSLYIETAKHKVLFDTGASSCFAANAKKLGVDLKDVDITVISHGHYDHGGGLKTFMEVNAKSTIYVNHLAYEPYYSRTGNVNPGYIGLDVTTRQPDRMLLTKEDMVIDNELELFMNIQAKKCFPSVNHRLLKEKDDALVQDDFLHEQSLVIHEGGSHVLIAGCAHTGIINIMEQIHERSQYTITHVVSGFHMYNRKENTSEDSNVVDQVGAYLKAHGVMAYTGHCTGDKAYAQLSEILGEQLVKLYSGQIIKV